MPIGQPFILNSSLTIVSVRDAINYLWTEKLCHLCYSHVYRFTIQLSCQSPSVYRKIIQLLCYNCAKIYYIFTCIWHECKEQRALGIR